MSVRDQYHTASEASGQDLPRPFLFGVAICVSSDPWASLVPIETSLEQAPVGSRRLWGAGAVHHLTLPAPSQYSLLISAA